MKVRIVGFGGTQEIEVEGDSADVKTVLELANVSPQAHVAVDGEAVPPHDRDSYELREGATITATPPKVNQG